MDNDEQNGTVNNSPTEEQQSGRGAESDPLEFAQSKEKAINDRIEAIQKKLAKSKVFSPEEQAEIDTFVTREFPSISGEYAKAVVRLPRAIPFKRWYWWIAVRAWLFAVPCVSTVLYLGLSFSSFMLALPYYYVATIGVLLILGVSVFKGGSLLRRATLVSYFAAAGYLMFGAVSPSLVTLQVGFLSGFWFLLGFLVITGALAGTHLIRLGRSISRSRKSAPRAYLLESAINFIEECEAHPQPRKTKDTDKLLTSLTHIDKGMHLAFKQVAKGKDRTLSKQIETRGQKCRASIRSLKLHICVPDDSLDRRLTDFGKEVALSATRGRIGELPIEEEEVIDVVDRRRAIWHYSRLALISYAPLGGIWAANYYDWMSTSLYEKLLPAAVIWAIIGTSRIVLPSSSEIMDSAVDKIFPFQK